MDPDKIKEAFAKAKEDIYFLNSKLNSLRIEIQELKKLVVDLFDKQSDRQLDNPAHNILNKNSLPAQKQSDLIKNKTQYLKKPTERIIQTDQQTDTSTDNLPFKALKIQNKEVSTGNEGVPADSQTDKQSDISTGNKGVKVRLTQESSTYSSTTSNKDIIKIDNLQRVSEIVSSLDDIKKELRQKFKKITKQEMAVFATIYQLEEEGFIVDYALLAKKLNLTESSIRDYIQRITKKGIPLIKTKENNKKILVSISSDLKKIASLTTILELREL